MEIALTVAQQVIVIFLLILVGFVMTKKHFLTQTGIDQITSLLLSVVTPCVLIDAYQKDFEPRLAWQLLEAAVFTVILHVLAIGLCHLIFRREPTKRYRINIFCSIYSNCGFMAIPLLSAALGPDGVFYGSAYLAVFTIFYWIHGVFVYTGGDRKAMSWKKAVLNPGVIGTLVSLALFFAQIRLPYVLADSVGYLAGLNTPLAMVVLGSYLSKLDFKSALKNKTMYFVCFLRLILIPLLAMGVAKGLGLNETVAQAVMISAACPTAAVATLFANQYHLDADYSSEIVSVSTLLSIITIPLIMMLFHLPF